MHEVQVPTMQFIKLIEFLICIHFWFLVTESHINTH